MRFFLISSIIPLLVATTVFAKTIAKVGDREITEAELDLALERYKPKGVFHGIMKPEEKKKYRKDALDDIIEEELLFREAKKRGIEVSKKIIDDVIETNIKRLGSKKAFDEALKKEGISLKDFKERIKRRQLVLSVIKDISDASKVKEQELKDYYEHNRDKFKRPEAIHLYHIYFKVEPTAGDEERQKRKAEAEDVYRKIQKGEDFGSLAYQYSEDEYKVKNGDMGIVHRGQLIPPELEEAAFSLKEGEVSGIVNTIYGFHILKAGKRSPEEFLSFDSVKERLKKELTEKRFEEKKARLLQELKKEFRVIIYEE